MATAILVLISAAVRRLPRRSRRWRSGPRRRISALPGVDGKTHKLAEYDQAKVLVVVFTCNHCPTAQAYEGRIAKLAADYKDKGVALVAISPNDPKAVRLDELGYTDLSDSLEDMKIRAKDKGSNSPTSMTATSRKSSKAYGPVATPHVFVFDAERKLRYVGRVDDNERDPTRSSRTTPATPSRRCWPASRSRSRRPRSSAARSSGPTSGTRPSRRSRSGPRSRSTLERDRPGRRQEAAQERHRQAASGQHLGLVVRRRASRSSRSWSRSTACIAGGSSRWSASASTA